ncbi:glucose 1-dehydrogenase [bacterium]|nr:glucose 1-dehydrogenase [bacterium]
MGRVDGKVALVTGGGAGIGRAICLALADEGAAVAVTDVDFAASRRVAEEIEERGGRGVAWPLDVTDNDDVEAVVDGVVEKYERIDILVNNAGIAGPNRPSHEIDEDQWRRVMDVDVLGVQRCTRAVVPILRQLSGGSIVNLSSIYGIVGAPDLPPYHAAKGAVRLMTKTDALLYAADGIRVNSVHPGFVWTPLVEGLARDAGEDPDDYRDQLARRHPLGRVGDPRDVAMGVVYLASDEASFLTGSELVIDGGYTAR